MRRPHLEVHVKEAPHERVKFITSTINVKVLASLVGHSASAVYRCHNDGKFPASWREVVIHACDSWDAQHKGEVEIALTEDERFDLFGMIRPPNNKADPRRAA